MWFEQKHSMVLKTLTGGMYIKLRFSSLMKRFLFLFFFCLTEGRAIYCLGLQSRNLSKQNEMHLLTNKRFGMQLFTIDLMHGY